MLGWDSPAGPLTLPARWQAGSGELATSAEAMVMAGAAPEGPASVCAERSRCWLKSKQGLLLTGDGRDRLTDDVSVARIALDTRRTTWWRGEDGHTTVRSA